MHQQESWSPQGHSLGLQWQRSGFHVCLHPLPPLSAELISNKPQPQGGTQPQGVTPGSWGQKELLVLSPVTLTPHSLLW